FSSGSAHRGVIWFLPARACPVEAGPALPPACGTETRGGSWRGAVPYAGPNDLRAVAAPEPDARRMGGGGPARSFGPPERSRLSREEGGGECAGTFEPVARAVASRGVDADPRGDCQRRGRAPQRRRPPADRPGRPARAGPPQRLRPRVAAARP